MGGRAGRGGQERGRVGGLELELEHHVAMETASHAVEHTDGFSPAIPTPSPSLSLCLSPPLPSSLIPKVQNENSPLCSFEDLIQTCLFFPRLQPKKTRKNTAGLLTQALQVKSVAFIACACTNSLIPHVIHVTTRRKCDNDSESSRRQTDRRLTL